jgi:hypothetical protein
MMSSTNTNPAKVPCKYCGKAMAPSTFERTGGFCRTCADDRDLTHGLFYSGHKPDHCAGTIQDEVDGKTEVPCRFCGSLISTGASRQTGGVCQEHWDHAIDFLDALGGEPEFGEPVNQKIVYDELFSKETKLALGVLFSIMQSGDELRLFSVKPQGSARLIAQQGVALFRRGRCVTGFVSRWMDNPGYYQNHEELCSKEEISSGFGREWNEIERKMPEGAVFVRYRTSPASWMCLCGGAGYAVKFNGKYLWSVDTECS